MLLRPLCRRLVYLRGLLMLTSRDTSGSLVLAVDAERGDGFLCPECDESVMLKRGAIVVPHFAHYSDTGCPMSEGESMRHLEMKLQVGKWLPGAEYEVRFGAERRADVVRGNTVVECQASPIGIEEVQARTRFYNSQGKGVLWVFDLQRIGKSWCTTIDSIRNLGEVRVPAEMRWVHRTAYGFLYVLDAFGRLYGCHLAPAGPRNTDFGSYTPKTLKWPKFHQAGRVPSMFRSADGQYRFVRLGEGVWWKRGIE